MADEAIVGIVRDYIAAMRAQGIRVDRAVLFGSHARGEAHEHSDIDVLVIAPEFDQLKDRSLVRKLWSLKGGTDSRIEPIPCGVRQWEEDDEIPIIEVARREGIPIELPEQAA